MDIVIFQVALLLSAGIFLVPKEAKYWFTAFIIAILITITSSWAIAALTNSEVIVKTFLNEFWNGSLQLIIDKLSAYFILIINFTVLTGTIYAKGYLKPYYKEKSSATISLHYFSLIWLHAAMLQVTMFRSGLPFLLVWELMSLSSFLLVIFEGNKENVLKTGINYLIQMHLGFGFLLVGFFILDQSTGVLSFDSATTYFATHNNFWLFLIFFVGFGLKAGFIPLHSWLPHAHPAAPSHVSGIMSGVMIKMGIYGILRLLSQVQSNFLEIGLTLLAISIVTGLMGIIMAILQKDLKKMLAYSSIENIGIIGICISTAIIGKHIESPALMMFGLGAGLLHVLNHSLFKSTLFYSAGSVYQATHTRNIQSLGGLLKEMPYTGLLFLISAISICGIPPFNGFISEFLLYNGIFQNLSHAGYSNALVSVVTIVSLALIGGLALFAFTKAFGITFLGTRRQSNPAPISERPLSMIIPGGMAVLMILFIGFVPGPFFNLVSSIQGEFNFMDPGIQPIYATTLATLSKVGLINLIFIFLVVFIIAIRYIRLRNVKVSTGPTWGCGYTAGDFKHQYTSVSYADNLRHIVQPAVTYSTKYEGFKEEEIFPSNKGFEALTEDKIESLVTGPANWLKDNLPNAGMAQTGSIHHYLLYPIAFMIIIGLITYFNLI